MKKGVPSSTAAVPPPRRGKKTGRGSSFWLVVGLAVAAVAVGVYVAMQPKAGTAPPVTQRAPPATAAPAASAPAKPSEVPFEEWEAEFDSSLWQGTIPDQLKVPPYLFTSGGALVKEVSDLKAAGPARKYRVLMFDQSGEVQGVVAFDAATHRPIFQEITLEYVQTMAVAAMYSPAVTCGAEGRALVLGLGAGSVANLLHATLRGLQLDVVEVSTCAARPSSTWAAPTTGRASGC